MLFLIEYERRVGKIISFRKFDDSEREAAEDALFDMEIELNRRKIEREVVLLSAENEEAVRTTHRHYFEDLTELVASYKRLVAKL